jgi:hypothetical protein
MRKSYLGLAILFIVTLLWGCTLRGFGPEPTLTPTFTEPSSEETEVETNTSLTETPLPEMNETESAQATKEFQEPEVSPTYSHFCSPEELETFKEAVNPYLEETIVLANEVKELEELSKSRAEEIIEEVEAIKGELNKVYVPQCLEPAYLGVVMAESYLQDALQAYIDGDLEKAMSDLQKVNTQAAWVLAEFTAVSQQLTPTTSDD